MNTWVVCCKGLPSEISLRKARKRKHKLKSPTKKDNMRSLVKFIGESMFTCFMCPFTATIESSSSCKLEDHQAAWWQDFWGLPQGAWWQDWPARRGRWGRGRCLRHPPPSLSAASPSWSPGQSYTCRCHWYGEVAFLPFCHSHTLKLLSHQTTSFKWACHDSCSRPPAKPLTTSPGMKYLSWNIQKQGATFFQLHVIPLKWILVSYIKAYMPNRIAIGLRFL